METENWSPVHGLRAAVLLALAAAGAIACLRAAIWALGDGLFEGGLTWGLVRSLAHTSAMGLPLALAFFGVLNLASSVLVWRRANVLIVAFVAALYAFVIWSFLTLRLPGEIFGSPAVQEAQVFSVDIGAFLASIWISSVVVLSAYSFSSVSRQARNLRLAGLALLAGVLVVCLADFLV